MTKLILASVSVLAILTATSESGATTYNYSGSLATYIVPETGTYDLTAAGAQGGGGVFSKHAGGLGALMEGLFSFNAGDIIQILVGGAGQLGLDAGGGGGGSFVATMANTPLLVAGGGGGAGLNEAGGYGWTQTKGMNGSSGGDGGTGGGGGGAAFCLVTPRSYCGANFSGGGGGGFSGSGSGAYLPAKGSNYRSGNPGASFIAGGAGGTGNGLE